MTTWPALIRWLSLPRPEHDDREQPGWSAALFNPPVRAGKYVQAVSLLVFDVDSGAPMSTAARALDGILGALVTSRRHTEEHHRYRIVLAQSRPTTPDEHAHVWAAVADQLAAAGVEVDQATKDPGRFWFLPSGRPIVVEINGEPLDVAVVLSLPLPAEAPAEAPAAPARPAGGNGATVDGERPGDAWARTASWDDLLVPRGWRRAGRQGDQDTWTRPGKSRGTSATCDGDHFYCFTSNAAPLEPHRSYDKLGLLAALEHGGDLRAAVRQLASDGYGERRTPAGPASRPAMLDEDTPEACQDDDPWLDPDRLPDDELPPPPDPDGPLPDRAMSCPEIAAPLPPLDYLLEEYGLVAGPGTPHMIAGYGGSGKTMACQSMLLSLASGRPVWGQYRSQRTYRVAHVDLEQGERLTRWRYQRLARGMGLYLPQLGDALQLYAMPQGLTLSTGCRERWLRIMAERDLVIVDSLRVASAGREENSSEIRECLDLLGAWSDLTGCRGLVLHHARKPAAEQPAGGLYSIRGSSALVDGADSILVLGRRSRDEPIEMVHERARSHGHLGPDQALVIDDVPAEPEAEDQSPGLVVSVRGAEMVVEVRERVAEQRRQEQAERDAGRIRKALQVHPLGLSTRELRDTTCLSGTRCAAAVSALGGQLTRKPGPHRSTIHALTVSCGQQVDK